MCALSLSIRLRFDIIIKLCVCALLCYAMRGTFVRSYAVVFRCSFFSLHQIYFNRHILVVCLYVSISSCFSLSSQLYFIWVSICSAFCSTLLHWKTKRQKTPIFFRVLYHERAFNDYVCPKVYVHGAFSTTQPLYMPRTVVVGFFCVLCFLISFHIQLSELLCI